MTEDRIARLEAQIRRLEEKQEVLRKQLTQARLDQWQGKLDDIEVQLHLGALEANDRLAPLLDQLKQRWAGAKGQMEEATRTASDAADTLTAGLESAYRELRKAVLETRSKLS